MNNNRPFPNFLETINGDILEIKKYSQGKLFIHEPHLYYDIAEENFYDLSGGKPILTTLKTKHPKFWKEWLHNWNYKEKKDVR
ncbi:hypothetical protein [Fulvivirga ligni]|uniref:hypothetical protein n=1 Tax=Fulvivirga ligni TaxID=2904246 RepID=UPI001F3A66B6|nr:hypothetical protein [Fulvivirga ligni]UII19046.1 hypothetical protein LVD16_14470 [Fulvivirga ligni]